VSIVVAWQGCPSELSRRLRSWTQQSDQRVEVVVVCSCPAADRQRVERAHPGVQVIAASEVEELSALRQLGVAASSGDIVVIFDDSIAAGASWRDHLPPTLATAPSAHGYDWPVPQRDTRITDAAVL
jgi:hypothetical protein